jgi:hypothetical protein
MEEEAIVRVYESRLWRRGVIDAISTACRGPSRDAVRQVSVEEIRCIALASDARAGYDRRAEYDAGCGMIDGAGRAGGIGGACRRRTCCRSSKRRSRSRRMDCRSR